MALESEKHEIELRYLHDPVVVVGGKRRCKQDILRFYACCKKRSSAFVVRRCKPPVLWGIVAGQETTEVERSNGYYSQKVLDYTVRTRVAFLKVTFVLW